MIEFCATAQTLPQQAAIHKQRMKPGRMYRVEMKEMRAGRSTGWQSQNHHINGHIQQLCEETGNSFSTVKEYMKEQAIDMGYPTETLPDGTVRPKSEAVIDTVQAGYLIDIIHRFAAEWGYILREE